MSKRGIFVLAVILAVAAAGCAPKANAPEDVAAVKALSEGWGKAINQNDTAALIGQFAEDAVWLVPHGPAVVGKAAIGEAIVHASDRYRSEETDTPEDAQVVGDLAYVRGTYVWKAIPKAPGEAVIDDRGKFVTVYRRQPDGAWKIAVDAPSSDLPAVRVLEPSSPDELALLQIERDWAAAWLAQDAAALDAILADGFIENTRGQISTKAQILAAMKAGIYKVETCENSDIRVVVFGDHAVVNGLNTGRQAVRGKDASAVNRWTDTFVKQDGRWRAAFTHAVKGD